MISYITIYTINFTVKLTRYPIGLICKKVPPRHSHNVYCRRKLNHLNHFY